MRIFALGFLIGSLILQQFRQLPDPHYTCVFAVALVFPWQTPLWRGFAGVCLGFGWALLFAAWNLDHRLPESFEAQILSIQGQVIGLPTPRADKLQFYLRPYRIQAGNGESLDKQHLPRKIKLTWFHSRERLQNADWLTLKVKLKRPNGLMNAAGFDYETWIFVHGIDALGYVRQCRRIEPPRQARRAWGDYVDLIRQRVLTKLNQALADLDNRGLILALVIGERYAIEPQQWQLMQNTGTNHLLAISGLHIGLVAGLLFFFARRLWSRLYPGQAMAAQRVAAAMALIGAITYAALAGFSIPTQRALAMVAVVLISHWRQRPMLPSQSLASAMLAVLLLNPLSVLDPGFWLSFIAVSSLLYSLAAKRHLKGVAQRWFQPQWVVFLGLGLLLLYQYGRVPLLSPLANILAIPWVSFITVPLCLASIGLLWLSPGIAHALLFLADQSLNALLYLLAVFDSPAWMLQLRPVDAIWPWLLAMTAMAILLLPSRLPLRPAAACLLLPLFCAQPLRLPEGSFMLTLFDVGQGLSVLVATREHVLVYDSGPRYSRSFDSAQAVIVPSLRRLGRQKIDHLVLSHHDVDHMGAAKSLMENYTVDQISTTWQFNIGRKIDKCEFSQHWIWDKVEFQVLYPFAESASTSKAMALESDNNRSCVIRIASGNQAVLLTGDIESKVERRLLAQYSNEELRATLLLVPHHGSKSSSSEAFIDRVSPQWALASTGYRNRFGFPKPVIVERYLQRGIAFLSTSHYGALTFLIDGQAKPRLLHAERLDKSRYWHRVHPPPSNYGFQYRPRSGQVD